MILRGTWNQLSNAQIGRIPTARVAAVVRYHSGGLRLTAPAGSLSAILICPNCPAFGLLAKTAPTEPRPHRPRQPRRPRCPPCSGGTHLPGTEATRVGRPRWLPQAQLHTPLP